MHARSDRSIEAAAGARLVLGLVAFALVGWAAGELWLSLIGSAEVDYVRTVAAERARAATQVAQLVTWAGSSFVLVPLCVACCAVLARAGRRRDAIALGVALGGAMLIWTVVKDLTGRRRPPVQHLQHVTGSSFPSGHATQAAAFWTSLLLVVLASGVARGAAWSSGIAVLLLVLAVAWSRVYLGVHYPADVVAGLLLGCTWALFTRWAVTARPTPG
jgi:membrane-associated phospholipid phosphatase